MNLKNLVFILGAIVVFASCNSKYPGFEKNENGLYYKFHQKNEDAEKPKIGDVLYLRMYNFTDDDTVLQDYRNTKNPVGIKLREPMYEGDINEGFAMMHVGDSATFIIDAIPFLKQNMGIKNIPGFIDSTNVIYFNMKLESIMPEEEFEKQRREMMEQQQKEAEKRQKTEEDDIEEYLKENNIYTKPTQTGLYIVRKKRGTGQKAEPGSVVKVNYTGKLLDGTVFDTSNEDIAKEAGNYNAQRDYKPIEFELGKGNVISGWDKGIAKMREGGKAKLIIPSHLGYGARGAGQLIKPFTPLVFEVELVEVKNQ